MKKTVLRNVIRLKQEWPNQLKVGQEFPILLNKKTGDIEFKKPSSSFPIVQEEWKELFLSVRLDGDQGDARFYLSNQEGQGVRSQEFELLAWQIANETINALNELISDLVSQAKQIRKKPAFIKKAISRLETEKLFQGKRVGTYIITEPDQAIIEVAYRMAKSNDMVLSLYILSILEEKNLNQYILIESDFGWTLLSDEPDLQSPVYKHFPNLPLLLRTLSPREKFPIDE
jgi:hypothetical protein